MSTVRRLPHGTNLSPFFYKSLKGSAERSAYIRLFVLHPGPADAPIEGSLIEVPSDDEHPPTQQYECVSYAWGDASIVAEIVVDGGVLPVTVSLFTALQRFRLAVDPRYLWIDAICINQRDEQEKTHQVGKMQHIYERATRVLVWLGESREGSDLAFAKLRQILWAAGPRTIRAWQRKLDGVTEPEPQSEGDIVMPWELTDGDIESRQYTRNPLFELLDSFGSVAASMQKWLSENKESDFPEPKTRLGQKIRAEAGTPEREAIEEALASPDFSNGLRVITVCLLLQRSFFERIWIVQEIAVAKDTVVHCGQDSMDWLLVSFGLAAILAGPGAQAGVANEPGFQRFTDIGMTRQALKDGMTPHSQADLSVPISLLMHYRGTKATDSRDKVYALLGILERTYAESSLKPDYSLDVQKVYENVALQSIQTTQSLEILAVPCNRTSAFPSWLPDWSDSSRQPNSLLALDRYNGAPTAFRKRFDASLSTVLDSRDIIHNGTLKLRGYEFDTITRIGEPFRWIDHSSANGQYSRTAFSWRTDPDREQDIPPPELREAESETMTMIHDFYQVMGDWHVLAHDEDYPVYATTEAADDVLICTLEGSTFPEGSEQPARHWKHLFANVAVGKEAAQQLADGNWTNDAYARLYEPVTLPGSDKPWDAALYGPVNRRRLARTKLGYLALIGPEAQVGHAVVLLEGGRTPYIAKPKGEQWIFVSDAYVHGIMYGEAWDAARCGEMIFV